MEQQVESSRQSRCFDFYNGDKNDKNVTINGGNFVQDNRSHNDYYYDNSQTTNKHYETTTFNGPVHGYIKKANNAGDVVACTYETESSRRNEGLGPDTTPRSLASLSPSMDGGKYARVAKRATLPCVTSPHNRDPAGDRRRKQSLGCFQGGPNHSPPTTHRQLAPLFIDPELKDEFLQLSPEMQYAINLQIKKMTKGETGTPMPAARKPVSAKQSRIRTGGRRSQYLR